MNFLMLRLFRLTPLLQVVLCAVSFLVLMSLIAIRLLYAYGLTSSLSRSAPHLSASWVTGGTDDESLKKKILTPFEKNDEVESYSLFIRGQRLLSIRGKFVGTAGTYQFEAPVEINGIELTQHPFAIPLDQANPLQNTHQTLMTTKELAVELMHFRESVIVNEAFLNLFRPRPDTINLYQIHDVKTGKLLPDIRIVGVVRDLLDQPRLLTNLKLAQQLLGTNEFQGVHARVLKLGYLDAVHEELRQVLEEDVRLESWTDGQNRQQKLFHVFDSMFWIISASVLLLSLISGMLGIYKTFMHRRKSISILLLLGVSKNTFFWRLALLNSASLLAGSLLAFCVFLGGFKYLHDPLIESFRSVVPISNTDLPWAPFVGWSGAMFLIYLLLSLGFLRLILHTRISLK